MNRPRLLDLFCGAGGAAMGYHRAGFDIVGVDINPQPHYPFEFHQADATAYPLEGFDAVHASPPCRDHSTLNAVLPTSAGTGWMLPHMLTRLAAVDKPFVVENVMGAQMPTDMILCGRMFNLNIYRHRRFTISGPIMLTVPSHPRHRQRVHGLRHGTWIDSPILGVWGHGGGKNDRAWGPAMGIDWMNRGELAQAIPPAYTQFIGEQLLAHLKQAAA